MLKVVAFTSIFLLITFCNNEANAAQSGESKAPIFLAKYQPTPLDSLNSATAISESCAQFLKNAENQKQLAKNSKLPPTQLNFYAPFDSLLVSIKSFSGRLRLISDSFEQPALREAARACQQKLSALESNIYLSKDIYNKYSAINRANLDDETRYSLQKQITKFQQSGVNTDNKTREKLRLLLRELVTIEQEFNRNINESVRYIKVKPEELKGLPEDFINAKTPDENGDIEISTRYPDLVPVISYAESDDVKRKLWFEFWQRAYPENVPVVAQLLAKRYEYAQLLGYQTYADYVLSDKMAKFPQRVQHFLHQLNEYTKAADNKDYLRLLERLKLINPSATKVELWQRDYLYELVLKEQLNVDSQAIRQYFSFTKTQAGILELVQALFDIQIKAWQPWVWHEDVTAYEVYDGEKLLGKFYLDLHPRAGKFTHAKVITLQQGIENKQLPIAAMLANFPSGNEALSHNDVVTFLHEFGHVLHVLFAHGKWSNTAGVTTERDFIEAPSQMLEEWVWHYPTLSRFATNEKGEALPKAMFDAMIAARDFNLGMNTRQQLHYAAFSLEVYNQNPQGLDVDMLSDQLQSEYTLFPANKNQYLYTSFTHLNGYSAAYYTYQWSLAISTEILSVFKAHGMMNKQTADKYRKNILEKGGSKPAEALVSDFLGRPIAFKTYAEKLKSYRAE
ncbi:tetraacyldisaccharide 4'-kinase [Thalassotalea euphylliae]|uniref:Tetraacyldisaccharide 4'-kinase n=1 Tax=Thalassotalea euphylliae TaxID=1655234 RepID=A0A3E0TRZ0_9GAMM|nr:M3 family metallopeptidase [Thalassotalea euphylliae]REL27130.1 tetraacyldisaccharide 4'-kinase [Thalassotalea euphylliae]